MTTDPELVANLARTRVREHDLEMALEVQGKINERLAHAIGCAIAIIQGNDEWAKDQRFVELRAIFDKALDHPVNA